MSSTGQTTNNATAPGLASPAGVSTAVSQGGDDGDPPPPPPPRVARGIDKPIIQDNWEDKRHNRDASCYPEMDSLDNPENDPTKALSGILGGYVTTPRTVDLTYQWSLQCASDEKRCAA